MPHSGSIYFISYKKLTGKLIKKLRRENYEKLFAGIIILTMAVGLFGCSKSDSNGETTIDNTKESVTDTTDNPTTGSEGDNSGSDDMDSAEIEKRLYLFLKMGLTKEQTLKK